MSYNEAGPYKRDTWDYFVDILSGIAITAAVVAVIFATIFANNVGSTQTYLIGSRDDLPLLRGVMTTVSDSDTVTYDFEYQSTIGTITSVALVGPLDVDTGTGPIFFGLCGCPPSLSCGIDTPVCDFTLPQKLSGSFTQIHPGGTSLMEPIRDLRANRMDYELRVFTAGNPTGFGAYRSKLPSGGALI